MCAEPMARSVLKRATVNSPLPGIYAQNNEKTPLIDSSAAREQRIGSCRSTRNVRARMPRGITWE
ncbi:protein of unknown function [Methylocaldum szegediense]|uniref:Uncharacterized protein n=1 Tax=Methylocaldum szegediense TaxID=73780 RepID=A0ABN8X4M1_9GAMM|nr:protein of unknown function [Methylocaldum szegediense]